MTIKRWSVVVATAVLLLLSTQVAGQGQLSVQVLQLLSRVNTWIATQTFQDLRMANQAIPSDTVYRIYADTSGNLYFNGGLIAGAGGGVTPHNLLGSSHPDTLTSSVARGQIVVGNSTPKWAALAFSANSFLQSNGTDVVWSTSGANLTAIPAAQLTGTAAAINGSLITNLNASALASGTVPLTQLSGITNAQIANAAGIAYSKLTLTGSVVNGDLVAGTLTNAAINAAAAIAYSKLALTGSVVFGDWASNGCASPQVPQYNGAAWVCHQIVSSDITGAPTVSSVALSLPGIFTVSGSPVTTSGTLTGTLATQTANTVFAGPTSGGAVAPTFRALVNGDLPLTGVSANSYSKVTVNTAGVVTTGTTANINTDTTGNLGNARGGTDQTSATNHNTLVGNGSNWLSVTIPDCQKGPLAFTQSSNVFSCAVYRDLRELLPAQCSAAPAGFALWSLPSTNAPAANCVVGTNTLRGVLDYAQALDLSAQSHLKLPSDWTSTIDINIYWFATPIAGAVTWSVSTACNAAAATGDPAFNAANTVTTTVAGTTLQYNLSSISGLTTTGCAAGSEFYLKLERNAGAGSDTMAGTARLADVELVLRRQLQ